jgi:glucosamine-6-phosphate deaminase
VVIRVCKEKREMAEAAANHAATILRQSIQQNGKARLIAATGAAQFDFLEVLTQLPDIQWERVEMFHLDEYIGIPESHPASFCRFLRERLINKTGIRNYHLLSGERDPNEVISVVGREICGAHVDIAFVGVGENGHLAFNDPPADFKTEDPYIIVELDDACRRQQLGEGWFASLEEVPRRAMSMGVRQVLKTKEIICFVPDKRKANAVKACFDGDITPMAPASILRNHSRTTVYLDTDSASLLRPETLAALK